LDTAEWTKRFEALDDIEELLVTAAPQYQPYEYFKKYILEEEDKKLAEKRLKLLENLSISCEEDKLKLELRRLREDRDVLLKETDWTQLADNPLDSNKRKEYRKYREYLRNLPEDIKKGKLERKLMEFDGWKKWVESVRHIPGYESYT